MLTHDMVVLIVCLCRRQRVRTTDQHSGKGDTGFTNRAVSMVIEENEEKAKTQLSDREGPEGEDLEYDTVNDTGNEQGGTRGGGPGV